MDELFGLFFRIMNSVLLVKYYANVLTPKNCKLPRYAVYIGFGMAYFIVQYAVLYSLTFVGVDISGPIPNLITVISFSAIHMAALYLLTLIFFKKYTSMSIFLLCSFFSIQEICFRISLGLANLSFLNNARLAAGIVQILTYTVVCIFSLRSIVKSFLYKNLAFSLTELLYLILPCVSGHTLISIFAIMPYKIDVNGNIELYAGIPFAELLIPLAGFVFLISLIAAVKLFQKLAELQIEEREKLVLQKQTVYLQEQIRDIDNIYSEIKGMRHDMKNHLYNIRILGKSVLDGNTEDNIELDKYLRNFEDTFNKFELAYQTGNSISDIIIHKKYLEAVNKGINFSADFIYPAHLNLDAYDVAVILDNGLENAIEGCNSIKEVEPYIKLSAYVKREMLIIEIENNFTGQIIVDEHSNLPVSSKPDKAEHGMGISNIQRCARKYYGDIDFQISKSKDYSIFHLTVMLQGRD